MKLGSDNLNLAGIGVQLLLGVLAAEKVYEKYSREITIVPTNSPSDSNTVYLRASNPLRKEFKYFEDPLRVVHEIKQRLNKHYEVEFIDDQIVIRYKG